MTTKPAAPGSEMADCELPSVIVSEIEECSKHWGSPTMARRMLTATSMLAYRAGLTEGSAAQARLSPPAPSERDAINAALEQAAHIVEDAYAGHLNNYEPFLLHVRKIADLIRALKSAPQAAQPAVPNGGKLESITIPDGHAPIYPAQCTCGHIFLEKYQFPKPTSERVIGFCWCGFCRTRVNVLAAAPTIKESAAPQVPVIRKAGGSDPSASGRIATPAAAAPDEEGK